MRISDWSSDVCSSDLVNAFRHDPPISGALLMLPFLRRLRERLGPQGYADAADELAPWLTDWRGRVTGKALAMVSPASLEEVRFVVQAAAQEGVPLAPQGGNTSMVAGATPDALLPASR